MFEGVEVEEEEKMMIKLDKGVEEGLAGDT